MLNVSKAGIILYSQEGRGTKDKAVPNNPQIYLNPRSQIGQTKLQE